MVWHHEFSPFSLSNCYFHKNDQGSAFPFLLLLLLVWHFEFSFAFFHPFVTSIEKDEGSTFAFPLSPLGSGALEFYVCFFSSFFHQFVASIKKKTKGNFYFSSFTLVVWHLQSFCFAVFFFLSVCYFNKK